MVDSVVFTGLCPSPLSALPPAKLMVNKQLIAETDSVTLECQAPPTITVFRCYFVIVDTESTTEISCMTTVTGRELLWRSQQTAPAVVQVECFYTLKDGDINSPSPHSNIFSITIQGRSLNTSARWTHLGYFFSGNIQKNTQTVLCILENYRCPADDITVCRFRVWNSSIR